VVELDILFINHYATFLRFYHPKVVLDYVIIDCMIYKQNIF